MDGGLPDKKKKMGDYPIKRMGDAQINMMGDSHIKRMWDSHIKTMGNSHLKSMGMLAEILKRGGTEIVFGGSLRSKRFRGVRKQRKTEKWEEVEGEGKEGKVPSFPSPTPLFRFLALAPFFVREKHRKSGSSVFLYSQTPRGFGGCGWNMHACTSPTKLLFHIRK